MGSIQNYNEKFKKLFIKHNQKRRVGGEIIELFVGDDNLIVELRKDNHFLVTAYVYRGAKFNKVSQQRFSSYKKSLIRFKEIAREF